MRRQGVCVSIYSYLILLTWHLIWKCWQDSLGHQLMSRCDMLDIYLHSISTFIFYHFVSLSEWDPLVYICLQIIRCKYNYILNIMTKEISGFKLFKASLIWLCEQWKQIYNEANHKKLVMRQILLILSFAFTGLTRYQMHCTGSIN